MIASIGSPYKTSMCSRRGKDAEGRGVSLQVPRPEIVDLYNEYMGGVDHNDQLRASYPVENIFKTRKWYKKLHLAMGIFGLAVTNSYILYKLYHPGSEPTHETFMHAVHAHLMDSLVPEPADVEEQEELHHVPVFHKDDERNKRSFVTMKTQPRCRVCALRLKLARATNPELKNTCTRTWTFCRGCERDHNEPIPLCCPKKTDCWKVFHSATELADLRQQVKAAKKR
jgi:hypothetical protein